MILGLLILSFSFWPSSIVAITIGSTTTVSVEPLALFPAADTDNEMLGFGWFANGFSLEDSSTTCSFNSAFPVSGAVNLNGGMLVLKQDLILKNTIDVQTTGVINGQHYNLSLPTGLTAFPDQVQIFENITISLSSDLVLTNSLGFVGTCAINGQGFSIFLEDGGILDVAAGGYLKLQDVFIKNVGNGNIVLADDNAVLHLDDAIMVFNNDLAFATGKMTIEDHVTFQGMGTFTYASSQAATIMENSVWEFVDDVRFELGKITVNGTNPLVFTDQTSVLHLNDCTMHITGQGCDFLTGKILIDGEVAIDSTSTSTADGGVIGNGDSAFDPLIVFVPGSQLTLDASYFTFNSGSPNILATGAYKTAVLHRGPGSNMYIMNDLNMPSINLELRSATAAAVVIADGKKIYFNDTRIVFPGAEFDMTSAQQSQTAYILEGNDEIFFTKGTLPLVIQISGINNSILGNGNITGHVIFANSATQLQTQIDGEYDSEIILSGGTILLTDNMRLGVSGSITGSGHIDLQEYTLACGLQDGIWTSTILFSGTDAVIEMAGNLTLLSTWTIDGSVIIQGNGNVLDLAATGMIEVLPNSMLTLKNVRINGLQDQGIFPTDATSMVVLDSALLVQSDDYTFSNGSLVIKHESDVAGGFNFVYASQQPCEINSYSNFHFMDGSTFWVGKQSPSDEEPLRFISSSSQLQIDDASLHITNNGVILTNGRVLFSNIVNLDIDGVSPSQGLTVGINSIGHDCLLVFSPDATLMHNTGTLVFNNYGVQAFVTGGNISARYIRTPATSVYIYTNLIASNYVHELESAAVPSAIISPGKTITLNNAAVRIGDAQFQVDNLVQNPLIQVMPGNATISIERAATIPIALAVRGTNNVISGVGGCSGPIFLQNSNAELTFNLQGDLSSAVSLNGGTLVLTDALNFSNDAMVTGSGTINLGNQRLSFEAVDTIWTSSVAFIADNGQFNLTGPLSITSVISIHGTMIIDGNGNRLDLADTARITLADDARLIFRNILVKGLQSDNIVSMGANSRIVLDNSSVILGDDLYFTAGALEFHNNVEILGAHTFSYASLDPCILQANATVRVSDKIEFMIGKTSDLIDEPLHFEDETANLILDNCSLVVTSSGMQLSTGTVTFNRNTLLSIHSTSTANGLVLGNGSADDTLSLELNPGATIDFDQGHMVYNVPHSNALISYSPAARFVRGDASVLHGNYDIGLQTMTLEFGAGSITSREPGTKLIFNNTTLIAPGTEFNITGVQTLYNTITLAGGDEFFVTKGSVPMALYISGSTNYVLGNGNLAAPVVLADENAQMIWALNGSIASSFELNGGTLVLAQDAYLSRGVVPSSSGIFALQSARLVLGSQDITWSTDQLFVGDGGEITLNSDITLLATWTLSGDCTINGNGKTLYLDDIGALQIAPNSRLTLKNIVINNHAQMNIACLDTTGEIVFDTVTWVNDSRVVFAQGSLTFDNQNKFTGGGIFVYASSQTSTVHPQSTLLIDTGCTFSYDPQASSSPNLLVFTDTSSIMSFRSAQLSTGITGIHFASGTIQTSGTCTFNSATLVQNGNIIVDNGIVFGDGAGQDTILLVGVSAVITLTNGSLVYNNIDSQRFSFGNELSTLSLNANCLFSVRNSIDLGLGRLEVDPIARVIVASGKTLTGSIIVLVNN